MYWVKGLCFRLANPFGVVIANALRPVLDPVIISE